MKKKIYSIAIIVISIFFIISNISLAAINIDNIKDDAPITGATEIKTFGQNIFSIITSIGMLLSVLVISIIGIKYMLGSAEEKAEYKKSLMPYVIGATLLFGASGIANAIYKAAR